MWTRRTFLSAAAATVASTQLRAESPVLDSSDAPDNLVYIGSTAHTPTDGIHVARWSPAAGTLSDLRLAFPAASPSFFAISTRPGPRFLVAGYQAASEPKTGSLSAFRIEPTGDLALINTLSAPAADFVHIKFDHTNQSVIAANYGSGTVLSAKIAPDGHLSDFVSKIQLTGHGPNASRQTGPHAHGVAIAPDNRFVLISDLGTDRIFIYKLNAATAELTPNNPPAFITAPGAGPRHLSFHPNGRWAYSINELDSTITQLTWNAQAGILTLAASIPTMLPGGDIATNRAGEIVIDKAGRFLYACNRGAAEELLTYAIAPDGSQAGGLTLLGRTPTEGKEARHFTLSPDERFLLVAKQFGNEVAVLARNPKTGALTPTAARYPASNPSCVLFA